MWAGLVAFVVVLTGCGRVGFDDLCVDCAWQTSEYGICSESCTTGQQSRTIHCVDGTGRVFDDEACVLAGERPQGVRPCDETGCAWSSGAWSACTANCDGGTTERSVECRTDSGQLAPDAYCSEPKPQLAMACNTDACCRLFGNTETELLPRGPVVCGASVERYMVNPDDTSQAQRCLELGYERVDARTLFTQATWCMYCNARTKQWNGTAWITNGCNVGVDTLRCCNSP